MKFLIFGDMHYKDTPPTMRKEGYGEQILHKISLMQKVASKLGAKIICTGDLFDKKYGMTLREINRMMNVIDPVLGWYTVLGNHDIQAYNQRTETQPIGILEEAGKIVLLKKGEYVNFNNGVYLTGVGYHVDYDVPETYSVSIEEEDCRCHVHVTHGMIVERACPWEHVLASDIDEVLECNVLFNGHNHAPFQYGERLFNVGGLSRTAKEKNYLNKTPKAVVYDTDAKEGKWIDIPCEEDVWKDESLRPVKSNQEELDEFVKEMRELEISDEDVLSKLLEGKSEKIKKLFYSFIGE